MLYKKEKMDCSGALLLAMTDLEKSAISRAISPSTSVWEAYQEIFPDIYQLGETTIPTRLPRECGDPGKRKFHEVVIIEMFKRLCHQLDPRIREGIAGVERLFLMFNLKLMHNDY